MTDDDPVALVLLAIEVRGLADLARWPTVGALLDELRDTAQGHGGLTTLDVQRLRSWARRWAVLPPQLRAFYSALAHEHDAVAAALWHVLQGAPFDIAPHTAGAVHQLYRDQCGHAPPWSLFPRVP